MPCLGPSPKLAPALPQDSAALVVRLWVSMGQWVISGYNIWLISAQGIGATPTGVAQGYRPLTGEVRPATELQAV